MCQKKGQGSMSKRTKIVGIIFAMVMGFTQIFGAAVPVNAATQQKKCSHDYALVGDFGVRKHEMEDPDPYTIITCYHGHDKKVVIPDRITFINYNDRKVTGDVVQIDYDAFNDTGVEEIVLPDTIFALPDRDDKGLKDVLFWVHKGSSAEKEVKDHGYRYAYLKDSTSSNKLNNSTNKPNGSINKPNNTTNKVNSTVIKKIARSKKSAKISWKKVKCDKYQIRYSTQKNMKKAMYITYKNSKTSATIKGLKKNKKYYVQIRTKAGKKYFAWSKAKIIKKR